MMGITVEIGTLDTKGLIKELKDLLSSKRTSWDHPDYSNTDID